MTVLGRRGHLVALSTRDLSGAVLVRLSRLIDVGIIGAGYRVYSNSGLGPVDYASPLATLSSNARHWGRTGLSYPADWRFVVRTFNSTGSELNLDRAASVSLDEDGQAEPLRPNRPMSLSAKAAEGGKVELSFAHDNTDEAATTTHFHVYHDDASGTVDYETVVAEITRAQGGLVHHVYLSTALSPGETYRFAVRAVGADDVEDDGTQYVEVTTDATAPEQPGHPLACGGIRGTHSASRGHRHPFERCQALGLR